VFPNIGLYVPIQRISDGICSKLMKLNHCQRLNTPLPLFCQWAVNLVTASLFAMKTWYIRQREDDTGVYLLNYAVVLLSCFVLSCHDRQTHQGNVWGTICSLVKLLLLLLLLLLRLHARLIMLPIIMELRLDTVRCCTASKIRITLRQDRVCTILKASSQNRLIRTGCMKELQYDAFCWNWP
jgi:succinate dehydrogenase hydrophobic anchor subunit